LATIVSIDVFIKMYFQASMCSSQDQCIDTKQMIHVGSKRSLNSLPPERIKSNTGSADYSFDVTPP